LDTSMSKQDSGVVLGLIAAMGFAACKHKGQFRKDDPATPYINHPIAVAEVLARAGGVSDPVTLQAALLHDTLEDTDAVGGELEGLFGEEVRRTVEEVTDDGSLPQAERKRLQVLRAPGLSVRARLIRLADKICNVADLGGESPIGWSTGRKLEYLRWARLVVDGVRGVHPVLESRFDAVAAEREALLLAQEEAPGSSV